MANTIVVFTLNGCLYCTLLKDRLNSLSIPFLEIEATQNEHIWNQVVKQTGNDSFPTVFIKKSDSGNGPVYMAGRDFHNEDEIIEIIKSYL